MSVWRAKVQVAHQVADGGAAAGLLFQDDQMCAINGTTVTDREQWASLACGAVGDVVFSIMRGGDFITVTVNKPEATTKMGVVVKDILASTTARRRPPRSRPIRSWCGTARPLAPRPAASGCSQKSTSARRPSRRPAWPACASACRGCACAC